MTTATTPNELAEQHIPYAKALAAKVRKQVGMPAHVAQDEIEGWALVGLVEAADRFDADRGIAFTTFAYRRIVGSVLNAISKMHDAPDAIREKAERQQRLQAALPGVDALTGSDEQAAEAFAQTVRRGGSVLALDSVAEAAGDDESPLEAIVRGEDLARMHDAIADLPADDAQVIRLIHLEGKTMAEAAEVMGISAPTVCRWNRKALDRLARVLKADLALAC